MIDAIHNLKLQYQGYANTPLLWHDSPVFGLRQLSLPDRIKTDFNGMISDKLVLGKRVEQFVLAEFRQIKDLDIVLENVQIHDQKITIGEMDCVINLLGINTHVEIVYKFYLFDPENEGAEIDHWVGPNRNDTLRKKLLKLKHKQLPLLKSKHTANVLSKANLKIEDIKQRVFFKAQLFTPIDLHVDFDKLNAECVQGFYINYDDIERFSSCEFYLPNKFDWLVEPHIQVAWISFDKFSDGLEPHLSEKKSRLCWIKLTNGSFQKFFVVWW